MEALVEDYLGRFAAALSAEERTGQPDALIRAYATQYRTECRAKKKPASGLLAALAEDPEMLGPVRRHEADFLARIRNNASDPQMATLVFLAINGLRAMDLLNTQVLPPDEVEALLDWLGKRLET